MCRLSAFISILIQSHCAPVAIAALLAVSLSAANETVSQDNDIFTLPPNQILPPSSTLNSVPGSSLPDADHSLSLTEDHTAGIIFHIPDTAIDLELLFFGRPLRFGTVVAIIDLASDAISTDIVLHRAESITNGFFQYRHEGLTIAIRQYVGKHITWYCLNELLLGIEYYVSQLRRACELRFEIEVAGVGKVGYGSLLQGSDVAKRAVNETSKQPPTISLSKPVLTEPNRSLLSPIPNRSDIVFSYHFFGQTIPETAISLCIRMARQSIRTKVQLLPHQHIPDGYFHYQADGSLVSVSIEALADNEISWILLDLILRNVGADLISQHHLWACEFEFESYPYEKSLGHGFLHYDIPEAILPANRSRIAAGAVSRTSSRLRYAERALQ